MKRCTLEGLLLRASMLLRGVKPQCAQDLTRRPNEELQCRRLPRAMCRQSTADKRNRDHTLANGDQIKAMLREYNG